MSYFFPEDAFNRLVHIQNKKNLDKLLSYSCMISIIDYYDTFQYGFNLFAPVLNVESINVFDQALIISKAANYKSEYMTISDIRLSYKLWLDVIGFRGKYAQSANDEKEGFNRQALTMISTQLRFQSYFIRYRIARAYAFFVAIPEKYKSVIMQKDKNAIDMPIAFEEHFGLSVRDFLRVGCFILEFYRKKFETILPKKKREHVRDFLLNRRVNPLDKDNLDIKFTSINSIYDEVMKKISFFFNVDDLNDIILKDKRLMYLEITSTGFKDLKSLGEVSKANKKGTALDKYSPLERYPIVKSEKSGYIVPNIRYFEIAITELLHYLMQEAFPDNRYNQTRGLIQEIYIKLLISDFYNPEFIIPETRYKKGKNYIQGPDITLCDGRIIAIESKAKRLSAVSRSDPTDNLFTDEISSAIDAFEKLIGKVNDLNLSLPEYSNFQKAIDGSKEFVPIAILVLGEAIPLLPEIFQDHIIRNNITKLDNYPFPFLLMDLTLFEKILVIVSSTGQTLYDVLLKYSLVGKIEKIRSVQFEIDKEFIELNPRHDLILFDEWINKVLN